MDANADDDDGGRKKKHGHKQWILKWFVNSSIWKF